jgi:hypothetical protein
VELRPATLNPTWQQHPSKRRKMNAGSPAPHSRPTETAQAAALPGSPHPTSQPHDTAREKWHGSAAASHPGSQAVSGPTWQSQGSTQGSSGPFLTKSPERGDFADRGMDPSNVVGGPRRSNIPGCAGGDTDGVGCSGAEPDFECGGLGDGVAQRVEYVDLGGSVRERWGNVRKTVRHAQAACIPGYSTASESSDEIPEDSVSDDCGGEPGSGLRDQEEREVAVIDRPTRRKPLGKRLYKQIEMESS